MENSNHNRQLFTIFPQFDFSPEVTNTGKCGCFVTKPKAILYILIAVVSLIFTAYIAYNYGPYSSSIEILENSMENEKLLNYSVRNVSQYARRLNDLEFLFYRIKIEPKVNDENATFEDED